MVYWQRSFCHARRVAQRFKFSSGLAWKTGTDKTRSCAPHQKRLQKFSGRLADTALFPHPPSVRDHVET
jgi:hypothetical protein